MEMPIYIIAIIIVAMKGGNPYLSINIFSIVSNGEYVAN